MQINDFSKPTIKILVTYKERHTIFKSDIITPIQTGRAVAKEVFNEMIGDDTGDNISTRNPLYSELSAFYWAWKNYHELGNPDYIGFMHYRRQFLFNDKILDFQQKKYASFYIFLNLDKKLKACFDDSEIRHIVPQYDYLIPDFHITPTLNVRQEYLCNIAGSKTVIFDEFIKLCYQMLPDYKEEITKLLYADKVSICNMFVMKKELFFRYCEFAFPILFELEKRINPRSLSANGKRFLGYMAEKLQFLFLLRLQQEKCHKSKILNCSYILNPDGKSLHCIKLRKWLWKTLIYVPYVRIQANKQISFYKDIEHFQREQQRIQKAFILSNLNQGLLKSPYEKD